MINRMLMPGLLGMIVSLTGCGSLSGVGGNNTFGCKAPKGIACQSVSGVYYNTIYDKQRQDSEHDQDGKSGSNGSNYEPLSARPHAIHASMQGPEQSGKTGPLDQSQIPARSATREIRIWYAPWLDNDNVAHDESYSYVVVEEGRWLLQRKLDMIRERYTPANPVNKNAKLDNNKQE